MYVNHSACPVLAHCLEKEKGKGYVQVFLICSSSGSLTGRSGAKSRTTMDFR